MASPQNPIKVALRLRIKALMALMTPENRNEQSAKIADKVINMPVFLNSQRISIYLSTDGEVNTLPILKEMFRLKKDVFVPTYKGNKMEMVKIKDLEDYENLPLTKWNIKQPSADDGRENVIETGGLDLVLMPGVVFTRSGNRCGHGMGYYDKFLGRLFEKYPERYSKGEEISKKIKNQKTVLIAMGFKEQIVEESELPMENHDCPLDLFVTSD